MRNSLNVRFGIAACIAAAAGSPTTLMAQPLTTSWTYQGKLMNAGNPQTSPVDLRFRLFDSATLLTGQVGADLFALNLTPADGAFTTELNFGATAFNGNRRWVEIAVKTAGSGTYTTLFPRQEVMAAPYSLFAQNVAVGATPWIFSGANAAYTGTGNVGAGTASPTAKLHIVGTDAGTQQALNVNNKFYVTGTFVGVNRSASVSTQEAFGVQAAAVGNAYGGMYIRTDSATGKPFYGYANTGGASMWTYMDGADNSWRVNMGSADRLTISSAGNVGIGTSAPVSPLDIAVADKRLQFRLDSGLVPGINLSGTGGNLGILRLRNGLEIWPNDAATAAGFLSIRNVAATPTITLDGATGNAALNGNGSFLGSLGVGTASPTGKFEVSSGASSMIRVTTANGDIEYNGGSDGIMGFTNTSTSGITRFINSTGTAILNLTAAGNVGIGTNSPSERLHVVGSSNAYFKFTDAGDIFFDGGTDGVQTIGNLGTSTGRTAFTNSAGTTALTILNSNGNIGIGTIVPAQRLDVRGGPSNTDFTVNPGSLFGVANASAVTLDTSGTGTIGVWDNFSINNSLAVAGTSTFALSAAFNNSGAPFTVANSTKVTNLNADLLDGLDSTAFLQASPTVFNVTGSNAFTGSIHGTNSSSSANSAGVRGTSTAATGGVWGVWGTATAAAGAGVYGINSTPNGTGVRGINNAATGGGIGVYGQANSSSDSSYGVYGSGITGSRGVVGDSTTSTGVWGTSSSSAGVLGTSNTGEGVRATTATGGTALYAERTANGNKGWIGGSGEALWAEAFSGNGIVALCNGASNAAIYCRNNAAGGLALNCDGEAQVKVLTILGGSDLAEPFDVANAPMIDQQDAVLAAPGMLVVIDPANPGKLVVSSSEYDTKVAGIISGANGLAPGLTLRAIDQQHADGDHAVAMTGRVWCHVDGSFGAISPGDRLTTSPTPGHAMKVTDDARAPGTVVGKAMTPLAAGERGLVLVLVNLQ